MSAHTEMLGGRLPLLEPSALSAAQKETYERLNRTWIPWANDVPFQSKLEDGRLIGPFNPILFCPAISSSFLDLQETEQNNTSLSQRVRQVVILAVGAVWKSNYELYVHVAAARKAGISEDAIRMLTTGGLPDELSDQEKIAQRYAQQLCRKLTPRRLLSPRITSWGILRGAPTSRHRLPQWLRSPRITSWKT